ncbi:MAG: ABC transporter permease, partial [Cyclobacteriaceae bacterium]|nr:ABC transporter permease [Cyclobacteriaceae bacterium]
MKNSPPKRPLQFLRWFCREDYLEEIEGDLTEVFIKQAESHPRQAKWKFTWSVMKYFRPEFLKLFRTGNTINPIDMFRHNFLIAFRNLRRYKGSFLINLMGLSTGLATALLIYLWVNDELSIDKFHLNDRRLYQVLKNAPEGDGSIGTFQTTPALMAQTMAEDLPEVEYSASVIKRDNGIISIGEKHLKAKHMFVSKDFFKVFSYKLLQGRKEKLLTDEYEILISDELAQKLFGSTENAIGKTVDWEWRENFNGSYTVAGIFEAPSSHSSEKFDILFAHALWLNKNKQDTYWGSNNAQTYIVLRDGVNANEFGEKIREYSRQKFEKLHGKEGLKWEGTLMLQRYSNHYLYDHFENGVQSGGKIEYVKLFSIIALFILVIACINFMNLSTAKASRRMKEVGIKKAVGAQRSSIAWQHLGESLLMAFLSLIVALLLIYMLLPQFNQITGKHLWLNLNTNIFLSILGLTSLTGLIAGSYPAIYLSGFKPAIVLKGLLKTSVGESWVRNGLVVFQFCISIMLIVSVVVVYKQISFLHSKNLGFEKDNIIRINNEGNLRKGQTTFHNEVKKIPGVVDATGMSGDFVGMHSGGGGIDWEGENPNEGIEFDGFYVDYNLVEMLNLELKEGRSFSPSAGSDRDKVIFNETAIAMMKLKDPVGKTVTMWGKERQIIGIVKNFHYESLYKSVGPLFIACQENNFSTMIKIKAGMEQETLER